MRSVFDPAFCVCRSHIAWSKIVPDFYTTVSVGNPVAVVSQPGPRTRDAMIAAAAAMALADGRVEPIERHTLLRFLRREKILMALGRTETVRRFAAAIMLAKQEEVSAGDQPHPWHDLIERLRPLAGMQSAGLITAAAAYVAAADGVVQPRELELLHRLQLALELTPVAADGGV